MAHRQFKDRSLQVPRRKATIMTVIVLSPIGICLRAIAQSGIPLSRTFLVFFDYDRAVRTDRARQIISEASRNALKLLALGELHYVEVNGYTDTSFDDEAAREFTRAIAEQVASQ